MKPKILRLAMAVLAVCTAVGCTTVYDPYGYPRQMVDPTTAVVGAVAVGALAYGLANNNGYYCGRPYYSNRGYYSRGYYNGCYNNYHGGRGYYGGHRGHY